MRKNTVFSTVICFAVCAAVMFVTVISPGVSAVAASDDGVSAASGRFGYITSFLKRDAGKKELNGASAVSNGEKVYLGGYPVGLKLYADGVVVVGTEPVDTAGGEVNSAEKAGIRVGDIIKTVNGQKVTRNAEVSALIEAGAGDTIEMSVERDGKTLSVHFRSSLSVSENKYKAGLWIRDSSAGIGTVTFSTAAGEFASLGHAVCDIDTKEIIPISTGESTEAKLTGFIKGEQGSAGELCGYLEDERTGVILSNDEIGVYGVFDTLPADRPAFEIAQPSEIVKGDARIYTTIENGVIEIYDVEITDILKNENGRNFVVRVTDGSLIEKTGGIIQGMSGSPVVQNGKIVGAVTHVFINDPLGGYGIFASTMLEKINDLKE